MVILLGIAAQLAIAPAAVTDVPVRDSASTPLVQALLSARRTALLPAPLALPSDTPVTRPRPRVVEVSEWYGRRLTLHRRLSYAILPLFAFQYAAGMQLWEHGKGGAPAWARRGHPIGAAAIGSVFAANTVTGVWNLWDSRDVEEGRARRYLHAASMLIADAGFTWAGAKLSKEAETSLAKRDLHRTVALTSMAISATSGLLMYLLND